jgi:putative DNA topoisomerase
MSKIDHSLFTANEQNSEGDFGLCPQCRAKLHIRRGKSGAFIGCSQFPKCDFSKPLHEYDNADVKVIDGSACPQCESLLVIKKGRYGFFIGCSEFPECDYIESKDGSKKTTDQEKIPCPVCKKGSLVKRANKYGKNFFPCDCYPKCQYALNHAPVNRPCPKCDWPIMQQKSAASGVVLQCPQRSCQHKIKPEPQE